MSYKNFELFEIFDYVVALEKIWNCLLQNLSINQSTITIYLISIFEEYN